MIADVSRLRARTSRVAFVDLVFFLSYPTGIFLSDYIYNFGGFYLVYGLGLALNISALLYTVFVVEESRCENNNNDDNDVRLFDLKNVVGVFGAALKRRDGGARSALLLLLLAMMLTLATSCMSFSFLMRGGVRAKGERRVTTSQSFAKDHTSEMFPSY